MSELSIILSCAVFISCALFFALRCFFAFKLSKSSSLAVDRFDSAMNIGRWILLGLVFISVCLLMIEVIIAELTVSF
ncbi:MAG: hypothetical protein NC102_03775 [Clostridium sp.]|nr:hypothetical protein [Clostridium sp.]